MFLFVLNYQYNQTDSILSMIYNAEMSIGIPYSNSCFLSCAYEIIFFFLDIINESWYNIFWITKHNETNSNLSLIYIAGKLVRRVTENVLANQRNTEHRGNLESQIVLMESVVDPKATNLDDTNSTTRKNNIMN